MYAKWNTESASWILTEPEGECRCGYRIIGGLYMVAPPISIECDRDVILRACPVCGGGIRQARGWTWIEPYRLFGYHEPACTCPPPCPICGPPRERAGLLWVGKRQYPRQKFLQEAVSMGISRRIGAVPRGFESGRTVVYLAHPDAIPPGHPALGGHGDKDDEKPKAAIIAAFRPWLERIFADTDQDSEAVKKAIEQGIRPVLVPDIEKHRTGKVKTGKEDRVEEGKKEASEAQSGTSNNGLEGAEASGAV